MRSTKLKSRIISIALSLLMVMTFMPEIGLTETVHAAGGTPVQDGDVYLIEDAEDFAAMAADGNYKLAADITVTTPYANDFSGTFDGDGHTITLNIEADATASIGLFKTLSTNAKVTNLITEGSVVSTGSKSYTGALAANANSAIITNCINKASVQGYKAVGGLIGRAWGETQVSSSVNAGSVSGENTQIGGLIGNTSGGIVTVTNCYNTGEVVGTGQYSNMLGGIIGQSTKSSATDNLINCYNVGPCSLTQSTNTNIGALVGNKSNSGTTTNCYFLDSSAAVAVGGVTAEGATSKTEAEMKATGFVAVLNGEGDAFVADTANINNGYPILAWQAAGSEDDPEADLAKVQAVKEKFDGESGALRPAFKTDKNIAAMVQAKVDAYDIDTEGVIVSLKSSDEPDWIAADGTISYNSGSLNSFGMNSKNVACVFTFTCGSQSVDSGNRTATVGWDQDYYDTKIAAEAEGLTFDTIKGSNTSADEITSELTLPQILTSSSRTAWSFITWTSSNPDVIGIQSTGYDSAPDPKKGVITPAEDDTEVTLTATLKANEANLNTNVEKVADFTPVTKTFTVTVKGSGQAAPTEEELQAILNQYYTDDLLKDFTSGEAIDLNAVEGDIQLPRYTRIKDADNNFVFANGEIAVTSDSTAAVVNAYRVTIDPFIGGDANLTVTFTREGISVSKVIPIKIVTLSDAVLDKEIAMMEIAKEHYFDGLNDGAYADKDSITGNLHAFQEMNLDEENKPVWVYNVNDKTGTGIIPDSYWDEDQSEEMEASGYNRFKSSDISVIQHENLVVTRAEQDKKVTVTSWLSSELYGKFAKKYPDNEKLQQLFRQEVSVEVTVKGTVEPSTVLKDKIDEAEALLDSIVEGDKAGQYAAGTKDALQAAISAAKAVDEDAQATEEEKSEAAQTLDAAITAAKSKMISVVTLTVSNKGLLAKDNDGKVMVDRDVTLEDLNEDGQYTFDEALIAAHKAYNSEDGYKVSAVTVKKLWGEPTTNALFFINGVGLNVGVTVDTVENGDRLYASLNADETYYADWITKFDASEKSVMTDEEFELELKGHSGMAYDDEGRVYKPVKGIQIGTWEDGEFKPVEDALTDENGKVSISFDEPGEYVVTGSGMVNDIVTDWNMSSNPDLFGTDAYVKYDETLDSGFAIGYTDEDFGNGPYPLEEVHWIDWMDWFSESDEYPYLVKSNQFITDCPIMAPACVVTVKASEEYYIRKLEEARQALANAQEELENARTDNELQREEIERLTGRLTDLANEYQKKCQELEAALADKETMQEEIDSLREQIEDLQEEIAEVRAELEDAQEELAKARKALVDGSVDKLIEAAERMIESAKEDLAKFADSSLARLLEKVIETAEKAIDAAKEGIDQTSDAISEGAKAVSELQNKVAEAADKLASAGEELAKAIESGSASAEELAKLKKQFEDARADLEDAQKQLAEKTGDNAELQDKLEKTEDSLKKADKKLADALATIKVQKKTVKGLKVKAQKKKAKVSWKKLGKGYKYEIYTSRKLSKGYKKAKTVKKAKAVVKKLKSKKTYYVKVRAFKTIGGKKVFTQFSNIVKVKIK